MTFARLLIGLACLVPGFALAASVQDIRIASHPDYVRVVLDLDGAVTFSSAGTNTFELHGLSGGGAVMNAQAKDSPLKRVVLTPEGNDTKLSFETSATVRAEAFPIGASENGGHRFVVDLYKMQRQPVAEADTPAPSGVTASSNPAPAYLARGPAVPAVPPVAPRQIQAPEQAAASVQPTPQAPVPSAYAAVAPSNPPELGPAPFDIANAQPSETAGLPPTASAAPANTIALGSAAANAPPPAIEQPVALSQPDTGTSAMDAALRAERALDRGDAKAACADAHAALSTSPQDLRAMAVLGSCQLALGDAVSARLAFTNALAIDPSFHRARIGLAETDVRQGDVAAARQEYRRVLADNPPTDETYKILDALQALAPPPSLSKTAQGT